VSAEGDPRTARRLRRLELLRRLDLIAERRAAARRRQATSRPRTGPLPSGRDTWDHETPGSD